MNFFSVSFTSVWKKPIIIFLFVLSFQKRTGKTIKDEINRMNKVINSFVFLHTYKRSSVYIYNNQPTVNLNRKFIYFSFVKEKKKQKEDERNENAPLWNTKKTHFCRIRLHAVCALLAIEFKGIFYSETIQVFLLKYLLKLRVAFLF